jgi:iron(III) transport system substrate-binding protein
MTPKLSGLVLLAALACRSPAPLAEVKVHATVSTQGARALASLAQSQKVARIALVPSPEAAEVAWFGDPSEAVEARALLAKVAVPVQPDVAARWKDPAGRFAPLCARARVLVVSPKASLPVAPRNLRDLADQRLAGQQALASFAVGLGPATVAALAAASGEDETRRFLDRLASNRPRLVQSDEEARLMVATGVAAFGLTGSEEAAAGAVSAAALEVVYPDQQGKGAVVLPTAVALLEAGAGSEAARRLVTWMAGPEAERLLVARAPGYLPLRAGVPLPLGVRPADGVRSLPLDWDRLAELKRRMGPPLQSWPAH